MKMSVTVYPSSPGFVANSAAVPNLSLLGTIRTLLNSEAFFSFHSMLPPTVQLQVHQAFPIAMSQPKFFF